jgi:hypothetical protein
MQLAVLVRVDDLPRDHDLEVFLTAPGETLRWMIHFKYVVSSAARNSETGPAGSKVAIQGNALIAKS